MNWSILRPSCCSSNPISAKEALPLQALISSPHLLFEPLSHMYTPMQYTLPFPHNLFHYCCLFSPLVPFPLPTSYCISYPCSTLVHPRSLFLLVDGLFLSQREWHKHSCASNNLFALSALFSSREAAEREYDLNSPICLSEGERKWVFLCSKKRIKHSKLYAWLQTKSLLLLSISCLRWRAFVRSSSEVSFIHGAC